MILALALAACSDRGPAPAPTPAPTPRATPTPAPTPAQAPTATPVAGPTPVAAPPAPTADLPVTPLSIQPISFAEAERADLLGAGCIWTDRADDRMLFIAKSDRGALKVGGQIVRFTADSTSADLGYGARSRFEGEGIGAVLKPTGPAARSGDETVSRPATLSIGGDGIDDTPRPGTLTCGA